MCKITLYIGDNAIGKTRKSIEQALGGKLNKNKIYTNIVTNIPYIQVDEVLDKNKVTEIDNCNFSDQINLEFSTIGANKHNTKARKIIDLLKLKGETLLLDEIDSELKEDYVSGLMLALKENKHLWKNIIINGYSDTLMQIFDIDTTIYKMNQDGTITQLTEDEAYEYFDSI